jgi:hypothetical protein
MGSQINFDSKVYNVLMSPEIILPADETNKIITNLPDQGFEELPNSRIFRKPNGEFIALSDGRVMSDSQDLLNRLPFENELRFIRSKNISELKLSTLHENSLKGAGIKTIDDVLELIQYKDGNGYDNLSAIRRFGKKGIDSLARSMIEAGIPPIYLGDGMLKVMIKFVSQDELLASGFSQNQINLAILEENKPKRHNMVRQKQPVKNAESPKTRDKGVIGIISGFLGKKKI